MTELVTKAGECLVVPGRDEDADALAEIGDELVLRGARLASGPPTLVSAVYDKSSAHRVLGGRGVPFAATASDLPTAVNLGRSCGWPLIVKPRHGNASREVRTVDSEGELRTVFRPDVDVAQQFLALCDADRRAWDGVVPGGQDGEYSLQLVLGQNGTEVAHFCTRNTLEAGVPRLVETIADGEFYDFRDRASAALRSLSAWGVWNFQGRRCSDQSICTFEVNARPTGLTGLRAQLGFNEIDLLYEALVLRRIDLRPAPTPSGLLIDTREANLVATPADIRNVSS